MNEEKTKKKKKIPPSVNITLNPAKSADREIIKYLEGKPVKHYAAKAIKSLALESIRRNNNNK